MSLFDVVTPNQVRQRWKGTLDRDTVEDFAPTPDAYLLHALKPDAKDIDEEPSWRKSYHGCMDRVDVWRKAYCPCCGTPPTKSDRCCPAVIGVCTSSIAVVSNSVLLALGVYSFVRSEWTDSNASITMAIMACSSPSIPELANFTRANCASELLVSCGSSFAGPNIPDLTTNPLTLAYRQQLHMVGFTILLLGAAALISLVTLFLQAQIQRRQKLAALLLPFYLFLRHERLPFAGGKGMPPMEREGLCCGCARRGGCLCSSQETQAAHDADAQAAAEAAAAKVAAVTSAPDGSGSTNTSTSKASQGSQPVSSNLLCSCSRALDVRCCGRGVQLTTILPQLSLVFVIFIAYYAGKYLSINAILFNTSRAPYSWNSKTLWRVEATCTLANGTTNAPMTYLLDIGAAQATLAAGGAQVLGFPAFLVAIVLILVAFVPQLAQIYSADGDVLSGVSLRGFVHCVGAERQSGRPCPHHSLHSQGGLQQGGGGAAEVVTLGQWGGGTSTLHPSRFAAVEERDLNAQLWVLLEQLQEAQSRRSECHCSGTLCLWLAFFTWPFKDHPGKSRAVGRLILETAWKKALLSERREDMGVFVDALQKVRRENRARREEEEEEEKEKEKGKGKGGGSGLFSNNPMRVAQASAGVGPPPVPLRGRVEEEGVIQTSTPRPTTTTTTTTSSLSSSFSSSSSSSSSSLAPKVALQPPSVVLPPHWEREGPDEEGEYWYFNTETEESQWEVPTV